MATPLGGGSPPEQLSLRRSRGGLCPCRYLCAPGPHVPPGGSRGRGCHRTALPGAWGRLGRRGGGAHACPRLYFPGHPPQSPGLLRTRRAPGTRPRTLVTRDSEGRAIPRGAGAERGPATTSTRRGGGALGSRPVPCPLSWLGRARGRDQDTAGLSRAGDRLCLVAGP